MSEVFEGQWWLPINRKNKIQGKLIISDGGYSELIVLDNSERIDIVFPSVKPFGSTLGLGDFDIINGYVKSEEDKDISICLQGCDVIRTTSSGLSKVTFQIENVIKVLHFDSYTSIKIQSLFLNLDYFMEWVNRTGFKVSRDTNPQEFKPVVEYDQPDAITLCKNEQLRIYIWFRAKAPLIHKYGPLCLDESIHLNIELSEQVELNQARELIQMIQDLFSFMVGLPVGRQKVEFRRYSNEVAQDNNFANQTCELVFPELVAHEKKKVDSDEMLITLNSLLANGENVFENWMNTYLEVAQVMRLYFDSYYKYQITPQTRFINLTMGLEIYHFRKINSTQGRNKPTLNERITELLNSHNNICVHFADDLVLFVKRIVKTRNYFTHGGGEESSLIVPTNELFDYSLKMRILLEVLILSDLGFKEEDVYSKIKKAYQFSLIVSFP